MYSKSPSWKQFPSSYVHFAADARCSHKRKNRYANYWRDGMKNFSTKLEVVESNYVNCIQAVCITHPVSTIHILSIVRSLFLPPPSLSLGRYGGHRIGAFYHIGYTVSICCASRWANPASKEGKKPRRYLQAYNHMNITEVIRRRYGYGRLYNIEAILYMVCRWCRSSAFHMTVL